MTPVLQASSFTITSPNQEEVYSFEPLILNGGESALLLLASDFAREVFFNTVTGSMDRRHSGWKTEGDISNLCGRGPEAQQTVLVSRNPENQLSACFKTTRLELALPQALRGRSTETQWITTEFLLPVLGLSFAANLRADTLSTGQKQRLVLGSALSVCSGLLLVDSPLEFIDSGYRTKLLSFILQFCRARNVACIFAASGEASVCTHAFTKCLRARSEGNRVLAAMGRRTEFPHEATTQARVRPEILVIHELHYTVPTSAVRLYGGLSITGSPGEGIVICGPNGSGKSTLAHIIAGDITPSAGTVRVDGIAAADWFERGSPQLSLAFPDPDLTLTRKDVRGELDAVSAGSMTARAFHEVLSLLQLDRKVSINPFDLDWQSRRRLSLAKAIKAARAILYIDEPAADADFSERQALANVLDLCRSHGLLVIVATNDETLARAIGFERVMFLPAAEYSNASTAPSAKRLKASLSPLTTSAEANYASAWLARTPEFSLFWSKFVYPQLSAIFDGVPKGRSCILVDLGCGHGMHTALVRRLLQERDVVVEAAMGVDRNHHLVQMAREVFGAPENLEFEQLDLTDEAALDTLAQRLNQKQLDLIFVSFFVLHDISSLNAVGKLLKKTQVTNGMFVSVLLSPDWVRRSSEVRNQQFPSEIAALDHEACDWKWVGSYPVSVEDEQKLLIPYYFRELSQYEGLLHEGWVNVRAITQSNNNCGNHSGIAPALCRTDEICFVSTDYRIHETPP
ncbi:MAG: energy-coupling factor transport system ATP-binding protein [Methylobacteriaceae bacterium]|nr:energy-coupling factor transport system ATP-binding protein [Methylobacteriaceae bacterium]